MENVKKCKNFLSTLIKLASSGKQSTETAANVKELVQNLLVRARTPAPALERSTWLPGAAAAVYRGGGGNRSLGPSPLALTLSPLASRSLAAGQLSEHLLFHVSRLTCWPHRTDVNSPKRWWMF